LIIIIIITTPDSTPGSTRTGTAAAQPAHQAITCLRITLAAPALAHLAYRVCHLLSLEGVVAFSYCWAVWHDYCHSLDNKLAQVLLLQAAAAAAKAAAPAAL
jgi:hypothetical protein